MNDAVDRVIVEREALDRGFPRSLALSVGAHLFLVGAAVAAPLLAPPKPIFQVVVGRIVPLPPGGGGVPQGGPPAPAPPQPPPLTQPPAPAPEPEKPKIAKPPKQDNPATKGLPPEQPKRRPRRAPTPEPARASGAAGGTGSAAQASGLTLSLPPGPGVPGGTDIAGDWYLAGVQRKIWLLWHQQIATGPDRSVIVRFTILEDGSATDVQVVQSSGITLLDNAAQRAVYSASPFGPLPKHYETTRYTIQALFKPVD